MSNRTILVVDDDEVLGQVLSRVLTRQHYDVVRATNIAQGLQLAEEHQPRLALVDLCLPDGDGTDLIQQLQARIPGLAVILMTAFPLHLRERPDLVNGVTRVLTKPLNLKELRQVVASALTGKPVTATLEPEPVIAPSVSSAGPMMLSSAKELPAIPTELVPSSASPIRSLKLPNRRLVKLLGYAASVLLGVVVATAAMPLVHWPSIHDWVKPPNSPVLVPDRDQDQSVAHLLGRDTLQLPAAVAEKLGVQVGTAVVPSNAKPLGLYGTVEDNPDDVHTARSRFGGEVVEIREVPDVEIGTSQGSPAMRQIRQGDWVNAGDLLAVIRSKDLGEKKSELVDAISQLRLDQQQLEKLLEARQSGGIPEVDIRKQRRAVETDEITIDKVKFTLWNYRLTNEEIKSLEKEAEEILSHRRPRDRAQSEKWARVEIIAPFSGIVVERNFAIGDIVDTNRDLFKISHRKRMLVRASAYEEAIPVLRSLAPEQRRWFIQMDADGKLPPREGTIERISPVIDPNTQMAFVIGHVDNRDLQLIAGQYLRVFVPLPPPAGVVAVPPGTVVDGAQTVVFVQPDPDKHEYVMRRVRVQQRFDDVIFIRSTLTPKEQELTPDEQSLSLLTPQPLRPGERIVTLGAVAMKSELENQLSKSDK